MRRGARTDANQCVIVETFRRCGWSVCDLSGVGDGVKDLLIGRPGINVLVEIKDGEKSASRRKLTPMQIIFHAEWIGPQDICTSIEEANRISTFWGERATAYHRMNTRDRRHEQTVQTNKNRDIHRFIRQPRAKGEDYE